MTKELEALIEQARKYQMTPKEREDQVRSFAYGNTHLENHTITKDDIEKAAASVDAVDCEQRALCS